MGKASRVKAARRDMEWVVRVSYSDGTVDLNGFKLQPAAERVFGSLAELQPSEPGLLRVELVDWRAGVVVRAVPGGMA